MADEGQRSKKNRMLEALEKSLGVVSTAAKKAEINRSTHYDWLKDDKDYAARVSDIADIALDFAESKLHKLIDDGTPSAIFFFLKCKGKKRGYIEKSEVEISSADGAPGGMLVYIPDNGRDKKDESK